MKVYERCTGFGHGVYVIPSAMTCHQAERVRREVDDLYDANRFTDRGASLSTKDCLVRDLYSSDVVYRAVDACCHTIEKLCGNFVTYNKHDLFVIVYDASQQAGLEKHRDGSSRAQRHTLLITLDHPDAYLGGGTRFYPPTSLKDASRLQQQSLRQSNECSSMEASFVVRPRQGCAVIFPPDLMHEGVPITAGRRHVVAVFTKDGSQASTDDKLRIRKEQYEAALSFEMLAIRENFVHNTRMPTNSITANYQQRQRRMNYLA